MRVKEALVVHQPGHDLNAVHGPVGRPVEYSRNLGTISSEINVNSLIMLLGISTPLAADVLYGWPYALYA